MTKSIKNKLVVLAAGGTGGHIFPAQALCENLIEKGFKPYLICDERTRKFLQAPLSEVPKYEIISSNLTGSVLKKIIGLNYLILSCLLVTFKLLKLRPKYVVGFGGYPSLPTLFAATLLRIPFFIHEQNAVMGRVNRLFARFATKIFLSFPNTQRVKTNNTILTGNFVRDAVINAKTITKNKSKFYILVIGGSQGAQVLSDAIPKSIKALPDALQQKLVINQQARRELLKTTVDAYKKTKATVNVQEFFTDVGSLLKQADLVVTRAGASSISELVVLRKPAILIPYTHAMDNHQYYNAKYLTDSDAGYLVEEYKLTSKKLITPLLESLILDSKELGQISKNIGKLEIGNTADIFKYIT